jgi:MFS family permease
MLYIVLPVVVIGFSAVTPSLQSLLSRHTAATEQGEVLGLGQSMAALARILGPVVGLILNDRNVLFPYWAAAGLMGLSILLTVMLRRPVDAPSDVQA